MAKDGTNRGGARVGSGRKRKPLYEKLEDGNPGRRKLEVLEFTHAPDLQGQEMPPPREMLSATEKDGSTLEAAEIYEETWNWLNERDCAHLIMPQLLERYAMSAARWMQCEAAVTEFGFLAKHPTTGNAMQSPYVCYESKLHDTNQSTLVRNLSNYKRKQCNRIYWSESTR